ncbi:MAG TPA: phosphoribosylformylglycinamidine cyclo-ligase [Acidimicrobiia bacterium]|nr:phosphoribosylformylglycinamidine cyclo-ligase [Acidimicrobiia bacterium]
MSRYRTAGVSLQAADRHVEAIAPLVTSTWSSLVAGSFGGFAAGLRIPPDYSDPVLMMTTDGVGTKLELARQTRRWDGVGYDLVAMVSDDLAAAGARPLGLVDYMAVGALDPERDTRVVASIAAACRQVGMALLGGETAEHPGVMSPDQIDLAAAALGVVESGWELGRDRVSEGDVVIGLSSPNLRSNGFSLVRQIVADRDLEQPFPGEAASLGEVLLSPSLLYSPIVQASLTDCHAAVHVTGGGLVGNLPRVLPPGLGVEIDPKTWEVPSVFQVLAQWGQVPAHELYSIFNMGIGFCLIVSPKAVERVISVTGGRVVGRVLAGKGVSFTSLS